MSTYSTGTDDIDDLNEVDQADGEHRQEGLCM